MWFITVFEKIENDNGWLDTGSQRTWGYYAEKETAIQALHENWTDMREYLYNFALIEYMEPGLAPYARNRQFFKWDNEKQGYFEIDEPEGVKHVCNFAIG